MCVAFGLPKSCADKLRQLLAKLRCARAKKLDPALLVGGNNYDGSKDRVWIGALELAALARILDLRIVVHSPDPKGRLGPTGTTVFSTGKGVHTIHLMATKVDGVHFNAVIDPEAPCPPEITNAIMAMLPAGAADAAASKLKRAAKKACQHAFQLHRAGACVGFDGTPIFATVQSCNVLAMSFLRTHPRPSRSR